MSELKDVCNRAALEAAVNPSLIADKLFSLLAKYGLHRAAINQIDALRDEKARGKK